MGHKVRKPNRLVVAKKLGGFCWCASGETAHPPCFLVLVLWSSWQPAGCWSLEEVNREPLKEWFENHRWHGVLGYIPVNSWRWLIPSFCTTILVSSHVLMYVDANMYDLTLFVSYCSN